MKVKDLKGFPHKKKENFTLGRRDLIYNNLLEEIGNIVIPKNQLNINQIKTGLLANNEWFYNYLEGNISIGKFCDNIAQFIVKKKEKES